MRITQMSPTRARNRPIERAYGQSSSQGSHQTLRDLMGRALNAVRRFCRFPEIWHN